tara:strand:+ start:541 stop:951 length:411 start_codon:yes stop_codon:yes gene_type:complete
MSAYQQVYSALTTSIINLYLDIPLAYENKGYDPDKNNDQQFIALAILYNEQESLDKMLFDEVTGIFQLSLYTRSGGGVKSSMAKVDAIKNYYKHGLKIVNGSQCVSVVNFGRNGGRNDNGWYVIDMSISFKSDIAR